MQDDMDRLARFGVSVVQPLLQEFDRHINLRHSPNRSEAIRDLIRDNLVGDECKEDRETVGTVTIVYDHHEREPAGQLTDIQHAYSEQILSGMHVHLDHDHCPEALVVKGKGTQIKKLADALVSVKGVKHGKLTMMTTGRSVWACR